MVDGGRSSNMWGWDDGAGEWTMDVGRKGMDRGRGG